MRDTGNNNNVETDGVTPCGIILYAPPVVAPSGYKLPGLHLHEVTSTSMDPAAQVIQRERREYSKSNVKAWLIFHRQDTE